MNFIKDKNILNQFAIKYLYKKYFNKKIMFFIFYNNILQIKVKNNFIIKN